MTKLQERTSSNNNMLSLVVDVDGDLSETSFTSNGSSSRSIGSACGTRSTQTTTSSMSTRNANYWTKSPRQRHMGILLLAALGLVMFVQETIIVTKAGSTTSLHGVQNQGELTHTSFLQEETILDVRPEHYVRHLPAENQQREPTKELSASNNRAAIPLEELVRLDEPVECPPGLVPVQQRHYPTTHINSTDRKNIPMTIHMTGKTKCLPQVFIDNNQLWQHQMPGHSFYFHDDQAVDRLLLEKEWPEFPQLRNTVLCLRNAGGAALADLWRYLALYEYGGIYTDMDNGPGVDLNETTITLEMHAFFVKEKGGFVSQFFFAAAPKHPVMFLAIHDVMHKLHGLADTGAWYVPSTTGPGATKRAFLSFMGYVDGTSPTSEYNKYAKPMAGTYSGRVPGAYNHTVDVVGTPSTGFHWIQRSSIRGPTKKRAWKQMNITSYHLLNQQPSGMSCIMQLYKHHQYNQHHRYSSEPQQALRELANRRY